MAFESRLIDIYDSDNEDDGWIDEETQYHEYNYLAHSYQMGTAVRQPSSESTLIFEDFQTACAWSERNNGKPFTRTIDGYYFTPLSDEEHQCNVYNLSIRTLC